MRGGIVLMRLEGKRFDHEQPVSVDIEDGRITSVNPLRCGDRAGLPLIAPGLVDLQVNGYDGIEFTRPDLTIDAVETVSQAMGPLGVTRYLPTVITQSHELLLHVLGTIAEAIDTRQPVAQSAAGIHLEGPFISTEDGPRGAHPREYCRAPDWQEFEKLQEAARGYIKLVTLSPEYPSAVEFTRKAVEQGILVAIGHTCADSDQIAEVVSAGARMSTHLGNGAHALIRRHPNYIWDQLGHDALVASLIVDGYHLPPAVVKAMIRAKTAQRVVLISDMTGLAGAVGTEPGRYERTGLGAVEVLEDGRVVVAGQRDYLAGATRPLTTGIANVMRFAGIDLAAAIDMASVRPSRLLKLGCGGLQPGDSADLIQFELTSAGTMEIIATYHAGQSLWQRQEVAE